MSAETKRRYTLEEYLNLERESEVRFEFWDGEIFAMSGDTLAHETIMGNTYDLFRSGLRRSQCSVFGSNMQIKVPSAPPYRYADGSVVCGKVEVERFNGNDLLLNPILIYEVLSPSTEAYDRGDKLTHYKSIASLREYLLIAQHRPHITQYVRRDDGGWSYTEVNDIDAELHLPSVGLTITLGDIYTGVVIEKQPGLAMLLPERLD
ncbi:MAG TPA: Uma2 family endonuclease [Blastocatellia bacterium]|nr:Uma2 family endonuclease [Blastocatellia bacterium]